MIIIVNHKTKDRIKLNGFDKVIEFLLLQECDSHLSIISNSKLLTNEFLMKITRISQLNRLFIGFVIDDYISVTTPLFFNECKLLSVIDMFGSKSDILNTDILTEKVRNLIILAHGEGIHLDLGHRVICSCQKEICRKSNNRHLIKCNAIKAERMIIITCNGFTLNHELYKDEDNLIKGFMEAGVKEIITSYMPVYANMIYSNFLYKLVKMGIPYYQIVYYLNDVYLFMYKKTPFVYVKNKNIKEYRNALYDNKINLLNITQENKDDILIYQGNYDYNIIRGYEHIYYTNSEILNNLEYRNIKNFEFYKNAKNIKLLLTELCYIYNTKEYIDQKEELFIEPFAMIKKYMLSLNGTIREVKLHGIIKSEKVEELNTFSSKIYKALVYGLFKKLGVGILSRWLEYISNIETLIEQPITDGFCECCGRNLFYYNIKELYSEKVIGGRVDCPICNVQNIYLGENRLRNIKHRVEINNKKAFFHISGYRLADYGDTFIQLEIYDKRRDEIYICKEFTINEGIFVIDIDIEELLPDIHSYKILMIESGFVIYLHGKLII